MNDYDTAKLLVQSYADAIPKSQIPSLFPSLDITNRLLIQQQLRLLVLKQLLSSKHKSFFLALTDRQFATLLKLTPKAYSQTLKSTILELLQ